MSKRRYSGGNRLRNEKLKAQILVQQTGRCAYCNYSLYHRSIEWDHFIPFSYMDTSGGDENWVASCSECNRQKSSKVFSNIKDITEFCIDVINKRGALGEGWPEDTEIWQKRLIAKASDAPKIEFSAMYRGFNEEDESE